MSLNGWLQIALFIALILLSAKPMGNYMTSVFERRKTFLDFLLVPVERLLYRVTGVDAAEEMRWTEYAVAMLVFSAATLVLTYVVERLQNILPWNPQHLAAVAPDVAINTAISFTTNTNWQSYVPESTMSYLTQMLGLATHNFWSAAVGLALARAKRLATSGSTSRAASSGYSHRSPSCSRWRWCRRVSCRTCAATTRRRWSSHRP
jgi:K+-transporting ATPase ATPase A chain